MDTSAAIYAIDATASPTGPRRPWAAPRARRLATSAAAFNSTNQNDFEGLS